MPLVRKRPAVNDNSSSEELSDADSPPQRRQKQPTGASRQRQLQETQDEDDYTEGAGAGIDESMTQDGGDRDESTRDHMVKKLVRLALACEFSRQPIRRADIGTKVLGHNGRQFKQVFEDAQEKLRDKFGMEMTELPLREKVTITQRRAAQRTDKAATTSKAYVLTSVLPPKYRALLAPSQVPTTHLESSYVALYSFLITVITLSGGSISEAKLERYLKRTNADQHTPVDKTDKLLQRLCKEGYLVRVKDSSGGEEVVEYMVGPRGKVEVGSGAVIGIVKGVYKDDAVDDLDERIRRSMGIGANNKMQRNRAFEGTQGESGEASRGTGSGLGRKQRDADDDDDSDEDSDDS